MDKIQKRIVIVRTDTETLSSMSVKPSRNIQRALQKQYTDVSIINVDTIQELEEMTTHNPNMCFIGVKQLPVSKTDHTMVWVSDHFDSRGIAYTGSNSKAMALEYDKEKAKVEVINSGIRTSKFFIGNTEHSLNVSGLQFPVFIKPSNLGNKMGVDANSVAHNMTSYLSKAKSLRDKFDSDSLVEEYLPGREFSVAVLQDSKSSQLITFAIEAIVAKNERGDRILATIAKSAEDEEILLINDIEIERSVSELAKRVFHALGGRDYGRIDIRLDENGAANFLEANLIPGLSVDSYFPIANKLSRGVDYDGTIQSIVEAAFARQ